MTACGAPGPVGVEVQGELSGSGGGLTGDVPTLIALTRSPSAHYEAMQGLRENVVPRVKGAPGFVKGTWIGDTETGHAVVVFESDAQAQQMAATVTSDPGDPVQVEDVQVFEVHAEA